MSRRALALALTAAFITGSALGLVGGILFARQMLFPHPMHEMRGRGPGRGGPPPFERRMRGERREGPSADEIVQRLREDLTLSEQQATHIASLIRTSRANVQGERDSLHARIGRELSPEQRQKWEQLPRPHRFPGPPPGPRTD